MPKSSSSSSSSSSEEEDNSNLSRRERIQKALEKKRRLEQEAQQPKANPAQPISQPIQPNNDKNPTNIIPKNSENPSKISQVPAKIDNNIQQTNNQFPKKIENEPIKSNNQNQNNNNEEESEESEYETDSEEEPSAITFISKKNRKTIEEKNRLEKERKDDEIRREKEKVEKRLEEKKKILDEQKKKAAEMAENPTLKPVTIIEDGVPEDLPDDDDELADFEKEFNMWKFREMKRLIRDTEKAADAEIAEIDKERRSKMTDEEVVEEMKKEGKWDKDKKEWKFMQKYYHKGSFFNDEESGVLKSEIREAIASSATLADKVNKELLPEIMKVKDFGKRGRTKYKHLVEEDTTFKEDFRLRKAQPKK